MLWLWQWQLTQPIHNHIVEVDGKELEFLLKQGSRREDFKVPLRRVLVATLVPGWLRATNAGRRIQKRKLLQVRR